MRVQHLHALVGALMAFAACAVAQSAPMFDVPKIAGKNMKQVSAHINATPKCMKQKRGTKCDYENGRIEIVFIDGKADWITINNLEHVPFNETAIASLGLGEKSPSFRSPAVMRWGSLPGLVEVSVFKGQTASDYAYIKVKTP